MAPTVNTRTLGNYLASLQASASPATTLVTQDLQVLSTAFFLTGADISKAGQTGKYTDLIGAPTIGSAAAQDVSYFALAASGVLANTALQPADVGTAAYANVGDFAVASQGVKADTAVQQVRPGTKISIDNSDPLRPIVSFEGTAEGQVTAPADFTATGVADATTFLRGDNTWAVPPGGGGGGGQVESVGEGTGIDVDATDPENPIVSIQSGYLSAVATTGVYADLTGKPNLFSGAYADLTGKPTLGTAAAQNSTAFATAAQGALADTALQPGEGIAWVDVTGKPTFATVATTGAYTDLTGRPTLGSLAALNTVNNGNWSGTALSIANGGTGWTTAAAAFTALKQAASATATGVVELATDAETQTGTDTARAITPANLSARTATETRTGIVELATTAEAVAGTDTARAVTPAGVAAAVAAIPSSAPGLVLLQAQTVSSAVAAVDFISGIDSTFAEYQIHLDGLRSSLASDGLFLRSSANAGTSFDVGGTDYYYSFFYLNGAAFGQQNSASSTFVGLTPSAVLAAAPGVSGVIKLFRPLTSAPNAFLWDLGYASTGPNLTPLSGAGARTSGVVNGIRLLFGTGNIAGGAARLYGVRKS